jgi:hypothetical protein
MGKSVEALLRAGAGGFCLVDEVWRRLWTAPSCESVPMTVYLNLHLVDDGTRLDAGMRRGDFYIVNRAMYQRKCGLPHSGTP